MKKQMNKFLFSILFMLLLGCDKTNEKGFYIEGKNKGLHKETKNLYDKSGYNIDGYNYRGYNKDGYDIDGWNQYEMSKNREKLEEELIKKKKRYK